MYKSCLVFFKFLYPFSSLPSTFFAGGSRRPYGAQIAFFAAQTDRTLKITSNKQNTCVIIITLRLKYKIYCTVHLRYKILLACWPARHRSCSIVSAAGPTDSKRIIYIIVYIIYCIQLNNGKRHKNDNT